MQQLLLRTYDLGPLNDYLANRTAAALAAQAPIVAAKKEDKSAKRKAAAGSRGVEVSCPPLYDRGEIKLTSSGIEEGQYCFYEQIDKLLQAQRRQEVKFWGGEVTCLAPSYDSSTGPSVSSEGRTKRARRINNKCHLSDVCPILPSDPSPYQPRDQPASI